VVPERAGEKKSAEEKNWNRFRFPLLVREVGAVTHLAFHPTAKYAAVTAGPRVHAYDGTFPNSDPIKTFAKFRGNAYGVSFRSDGLLMVVGGEEGRVRVYDERTKAQMKQFTGHVGAVRVAKFFADKVSVLSGGDDGTVRKWDVPTETQLVSTAFHSDYVRCGFTMKSTPAIGVTGGYDKRMIAVDSRTEQIAFSVGTEFPIEEMLSYGGEANLAIANGNLVNLFDVRSLDRGPLSTLSNHAKTVTCLSTAEDESRLLTGSVDQTVKVWSLNTPEYQCLLTQRFTAPILCMGMAPWDQFFVVGMADGLLSMQHRPQQKTGEGSEGSVGSAASAAAAASYAEATVGGAGTFKVRRTRGVDHKPDRGDFRVASGARVYQGKADAFLRKFEYKQALDAVLLESPSSSAAMVIALLSDLIDRRALDAALSGRDDESLVPLLEFLHKQINKPFFDEICIDVLDRIIELYSDVVAQSAPLSEHLRKIRRKLNDEIELQLTFMELAGQVETVAASRRKK
jgi:U3 small nucleolar RNA-associated protein 15